MARNPRFGRPGGSRRLTSLAAAVVINGGGVIVIPTPTPTPTSGAFFTDPFFTNGMFARA
ncbi:hypothetical protein [Sphingomonas sp. CFBP 13733]|uniref:hypothetical protein n=1 Tax=Sphingomonas sp. CFBP 13733 TaxID=2775291 RepID=UPI001A7F02A3|nr:hypothetical protein [Sphingomonas sp. CFBP 13733]